MVAKGIANDTTVVFYGDKNNWWAYFLPLPSRRFCPDEEDGAVEVAIITISKVISNTYHLAPLTVPKHKLLFYI